ncbi:hypothetical protein CHS0354_039231 [Potamilus streckersoni]|uniref:Uncharacterized protein n=1 Tax=Potamilus streckersoni TaxID=2493646 RepID=A0AAE0TD50_9BIVA|nr:hypothetical protein CHS0354_039231 [Potamilus streckersoni]
MQVTSEYAEMSDKENDNTCNDHKVMEHVSFQPAYQDEEISKTMGIKIDLTVVAVKHLEDDNKSRFIEAKVNKQFDFKGLCNILSYVDDSEQVAFYTELPNYEGHMNNNSKSLWRLRISVHSGTW